jgi:transposase
VGQVPGGHGERLTVIGALGLEGVVASRSLAAATTAAVFLAFVEQALLPARRGRPDAVVVMDHRGAHKAARVRRAVAAAKVAYRDLPSSSPDFNPIEPCWSKLKGGLRARAARTLEAREAELGPALATITAQDAQGWFRLGGYSPPN